MERTRKRGSPQTVSFLRERNALRRRVCPSRDCNVFAPKARHQIEITALVSLQTANKLCLRFDKEETWNGQEKEAVRRLSLFCGSGMLSDAGYAPLAIAIYSRRRRGTGNPSTTAVTENGGTGTRPLRRLCSRRRRSARYCRVEQYAGYDR